MHRTQILLEKGQYKALQKMAKSQGKSMGQLIREFVELGLRRQEPKGPDTLESLQGFIPEADIAGRDHDRALYEDE